MVLMPHLGFQLEAMVPTSTTKTPAPTKKQRSVHYEKKALLINTL